jgi:hypothetical protein
MITDKTFILTGASGQTFTNVGAYTTDYVDLTASGRGSLGDGEDLYAVFHLTAPPSGSVTNVIVELRASDTADATSLTGDVRALGTSRVYPIGDLGYTPTTITTVDTTNNWFVVSGAVGHGLQANEAIYITSTLTWPGVTGITDFKLPVYVSATSLTTNNFRVALTPGGTAVTLPSAGTGVIGFRRATAGAGQAVSPAIEFCLNPDATSRGLRYVQAFVTLTNGSVATHTAVPMTGVITLNPTDNQRYRVYPTSIVVG